MAEQATERIHVSASPERCFAVAVDIERYPEWAADIKRLPSTSGTIRAARRWSASGRPPSDSSTNYTLAFDGDDAPRGVGRRLTQGDITAKLDGSYVFEADGESSTEVLYHLEVVWRVPIRGVHQDAGAEPDNLDRPAGAEGAGRVPGVTAARPSAAAVALGVDVGGTKVLGVRMERGRIVGEARLPTPHGLGGPQPADVVGTDVVDAVAGVVEALADPADGTPPGAAMPVGVGVPGMVDRRGVLRFAPNLPAAAGADVGGLLRRRLGRTAVLVENDATLAVLAEHQLGAARGVDHVLLVTLGTGIGGGLVIGGQVQTGAHGFAGEIGHLVVDPSGPLCPCGRRGCWERYASGGGLGRLAREAAYAGRLGEVVELAGGDPESVRGEHVTRAAGEGDPGALAVLAQLGWWVALGLANLVAVVDAALIVLGGGLAAAGDNLLEPTRRAFADQVEGGPPVRRSRSSRPPWARTPGRWAALAVRSAAAVPDRRGGSGSPSS